MTKEQAIHDLIVIKEFFEKESGATPMCIEYAIETLEKEQAEQIVTCKDCRYRKMKKTTFRGEPLIYYRCSLLEREVEEDEFCSWGDEK